MKNKKEYYKKASSENIFIEASELPGLTSSRLKSTPPIGAPKATETPAAAAAESTYKANIYVQGMSPLKHQVSGQGKLRQFEPTSPLSSFLRSCCTLRKGC